ncbi:MAG: PilZ domain-containing protein [Polyangiaceae bacterium]
MSTEDRRAPGAARVSFDGLVEVGGTLGPSFEAQAVNVSEEGMQLRTAYLPELGQKITCRFEAGPNQSVIGSGEVVWCRGAERGGEFGIRFTDIDADSVEALKHVCGMSASAGEAQPGAKVRLYIEGLASPMRAKIRDSRPTAITVGSDLGFLQVGKHLELEDARSGSKRPASIDHVGVAVDPNSQVPQLVVTLRYSDLPPDGPVDEVAASAASDPATGSDGLAGLGDASSRMRGAFATQAGRLGPALQRWARRAKMTIALLAKRGRIEDESYPRRTTAPAPSGGLHSSGRRVVRGDEGKSSTGRRSQAPSEGERTRPLPRAVQRKAAAAGVVLLVALAGAMAMKKWHHEPAIVGSAAAPPASETPAATSATPAAPPMTPPAANPQAAAEPTPAAPLAAGTGSEATAAAPSTSAIDDGTDGSHQTAHKKHARVTPFGNASVHHGNVLRLKMDGPVESIEGAQQPTGFEVKVPGRRSLEAASPLAARDSRIASIKVNNESTGAMLTVAFKDGVPNYQVSAKGDTLVIALAPMGPLEATVAKRDDRTSKSAKHGTRTRDDSPER